MRYIVLTGILVSAFCAGAYAEDEAKGGAANPAGHAIVIREASGQGPKHLDPGSRTEGGPSDPASIEYGTGDDGLMEPQNTYDDDTGLPNSVPSDTYGELR